MTLRHLLSALALTVLAASAQQPIPYRRPIVFCRGEMGPGERPLNSTIWVMEDDGSRQQQLTHGPTYDDHPALYSDMRTILYSEFNSTGFEPKKGARLIHLDLYTGKKTIYAEVPGCALHHASIAIPGDLLAYHRDCGARRSVWIGWGPGAYEIGMGAINAVALPGGGAIFMHEKNLGHSPRQVSLVRMQGHGAGATATFLTDDHALHRRPAVSPDGKWLAWQTNVEGKGDELYLAKIDGSEPRNLTGRPGDDGHPFFSRDGKTIVFESNHSGAWEIWKIDLPAGRLTQLTFGGKQWESTRPRF